MAIIDDPVLALIARFVTNDLDNLSISDENFLRNQADIIYTHIKDAPEEEQQQLALQWIKEHAENYREDWLKKTLSRRVADRRCQDCPLLADGSKHCTIHKKWVKLLNEYIAGRIDAEEYIEETLHILKQHKNELKISKVLQRVQSA